MKAKRVKPTRRWAVYFRGRLCDIPLEKNRARFVEACCDDPESGFRIVRVEIREVTKRKRAKGER